MERKINNTTAFIAALGVMSVTIVYVLLGLFTKPVFGPDNKSAFESFWILYLLIPIVTSIYISASTKKISSFDFPTLISFIQLSIGIFFGVELWQYCGIMFLFIPIFFTVAKEIDSKRQNGGNDHADNLSRSNAR